jgi:hypothetical protein
MMELSHIEEYSGGNFVGTFKQGGILPATNLHALRDSGDSCITGGWSVTKVLYLNYFDAIVITNK